MQIRWENPSRKRYYEIHYIQKDLLGDPVLVFVHGGIGQPTGNVRTVAVDNDNDGFSRLEKEAKRREKHGYNVVGFNLS